MAKTRAQIIRKHAAHGSAAAPPPRPESRRGNGSLVLIAAAVATAFLFWYFHLLTLGQMTQLSDGLTMPDMMIGGYDVTYVERLRAVMDDDARGQLSYLHKTAGTLFPLMFAFTWLLLVQLMVRPRALRWLMWSPVLLFTVADLWENVAIDAALSQSSPGAGAVALASALTVSRWVLLAVCLLTGVAAAFLPRRLRPTDTARAPGSAEQVG